MIIGRNLQNPGYVHRAGRAWSVSQVGQPEAGSLQTAQPSEAAKRQGFDVG